MYDNRNEKIVITTDGKTTTAKLYKDCKVVKVTTSKCHPEDEFDFITGANLAMERLVKAVKPISVGGFKVGDRVNYIGVNGTVICISEDDDIGVEFDEKPFKNIDFIGHNCEAVILKDGKRGTKGTSSWVGSEYLTHGEVPTYYNGKVVCVHNVGNKSIYTIGKIYEFVDGKMVDDTGHTNPFKPVKSFKEWSNRTSSKFIEIVE